MSEDTMKVMIVDDHDMVRLGLRNYLLIEPSITVIGEASNGAEALRALQNGLEGGMPDVILMDLFMPEMDGVEATRKITEQFPQIKIVILTSFLEDDKVVQAVEAGAVSYVLKTVSADELVTVLKGARQGAPVMNSEVSRALTRALRQRSVRGDDAGLTEREKEVLLLIADGRSNKEIAEELHISIKTVKTHVSNLLMKCEVEDRTQLAIYAHRKGWVSSSS
jgi:NarL family two-component system response regulator LiaR